MGTEFAALVQGYGRTVTLRTGAGAELPAMAFLQPVLQRGEEQSIPTPLGLTRQDKFLYLGDPAGDLSALGAEGGILSDGVFYRVETAHKIYVGQSFSHWWAILRPREG